MPATPRPQIAPPAEGHLIIDPTEFNSIQHEELSDLARARGGWQHPDGVRWIIPVQAPNTTRATWINHGWPPHTIQIAH